MSDIATEKRRKAKEFGVLCEKLAAQYYEKMGFSIIRRNFRSRQGEIDVIAQKGNLIVFIEVKARAANSIAAPYEFVDYRKQKKIILAAKYFLAQTKDSGSFLRFDVVSIVKQGDEYKLECIESAFDAY